MMPPDTALVFPGSGSQYVGMCQDIAERCAGARRVFQIADAILPLPLSDLCFHGPAAMLDDAHNAQPALVTASAAILAALEERQGTPLQASFVAGHSTGEYSAMLAAGCLDLPSALLLVRERAELMSEAAVREPGAMAAVLGLSVEPLRAICEQVGGVWLANDNAPGQIVISGKKASVEQAGQLAMAHGARRVIALPVGLASHCPMMQSVTDSLAKILPATPVWPARVPLIGNVSAQPITTPQEIRSELLQQPVLPVRWVESVRYMLAQGIRTFVEVGPKDVLTGLIRRIDPTVCTIQLGTIQDIDAWEARR